MKISTPRLNDKCPYLWSFEIKHYGVAAGWRGRLAYALRWLASRTDGRTALLFFMGTEPPIDEETKERVLKSGVLHMRAGLDTAARHQAVDVAIDKVLAQGEPDEKARP